MKKNRKSKIKKNVENNVENEEKIVENDTEEVIVHARWSVTQTLRNG